MNENSSSATQSLPPQALPTLPNDEVENIASTILYCFLSLFVILGNVLVVAAFRFNRRLRTINNTFLVGLAVSDLLVGLISIPLWIYISSCQQLITCVIDQDLLTFYSTVDIFTGCASVLQLTAISIERYLAITRPINHRAYSMWIYYGMIMTAWSFAFIMAGLFPVQMNKWQKPYSIILFTGCFAVPALIIVTVYAIIFQAAKGTTRARVHPAGHGGNSAQSEAKIAATIAVITGLFIIAWLPFCIVNLFAEFWHHLLPPFPEILRLIRFVKWMHYSNSMVNPMVYAYRNAVVASDTELFGLMPQSEPIAEGTVIHLHHEEEREIIVATTRTLPSKELLLEGDYRLKTEGSIVQTPVIAHFGIVLVWFPSRTK
ncbi:hypothetical protein pdam_00006508 [Pocillopora damicornis]|uniref:G-protein coupled receptors family 1 profile domain-containing protein n=1 Tax=Pocillopora damicornis TaxID=46731 RepID=A0A3M6THF9_POCDA|nr:hypothetical protein pdam_00006508 [Pocillopora damicornis]